MNRKQQILVNEAKQLIALESMLLANEREWYQHQLRYTLAALEAFKATLRSKYGITISELVKMPHPPQDLMALAQIIAQVKRKLASMKINTVQSEDIKTPAKHTYKPGFFHH